MKKIIILLAVLVAYSSWGQNSYSELLKAPKDTATTLSITRTWKDNVQITYVQNIEYNPYNLNEIISSTAKFVFYNPTDNNYKVAEFDNHKWPHVTDFEILDDTLYFCGYANVAASSTSPFYMGFVGYFCIPQLIAGKDDIYAYTFKPQPNTPDIPYWFINDPCKIEVFKVATGIHLVCTGGWSRSRSSLANGGYFVADVVHEFATDNWWYYITSVSDVAMMNNYYQDIVEGFINGINHNPRFNWRRISSAASGDQNVAFGTTILPVTIKSFEKETIGQP